MKDIARMALKNGMEIAKDIVSSSGEVLVKAGTKVTDYTIQKLTRHNIIVVTVMEDIDYAVTYFEKIRLSDSFKVFEAAYMDAMPKYKKIMMDFVESDIPIDINALMQIYDNIMFSVKEPEKVLDYLYNMLPSEDDMTHAHCLNSALIAGVFGNWLCLPEQEIKILIQCAFFYDIGKLKLPYDLIWKPGKLTPIEFAQIKTHTILGFQLIQDLPIDDHILKATLAHHERYDGSGYPSKLHDVQIDKYARIIAIIDSYEAMTSARTYRQSKHPFQVIEIFEKDEFKYDMEILSPILYRIANHMIGLKVLLNNDVKAEVLLINQANISRPLLRDDNNTFIDLINRKDLQILGIY